jgi:hypothetical protein
LGQFVDKEVHLLEIARINFVPNRNAVVRFNEGMKRRQFMAGSAVFVANSVCFARAGFASPSALWQDQAVVVSESQLKGLLQGWLDAFNADMPSAYRAFIGEYLPDGLPYLDDDLAVRDVSGGFQLLRTEAHCAESDHRLGKRS